MDVLKIAEDAENGFIPATGKVHVLNAPKGFGVRFDSGLRQGQEVTADFDPMLAKLIVHARTRGSAYLDDRSSSAHDLSVPVVQGDPVRAI